jgi:hypothetical protein
MAYSINDRNTNSTDNRNSRMVQGGLTDRYSNRLGWWERRKLTKQDNDLKINVLEHEAARPDLISYRVYGKAKYAWLVLQYNNIVDPETELTTGTELVLPTKQRLTLDILTKSEGGNPIT